MHALFYLYYVVIYEFKYESKMINPCRLVLAGRDRIFGIRALGYAAPTDTLHVQTR